MCSKELDLICQPWYRPSFTHSFCQKDRLCSIQRYSAGRGCSGCGLNWICDVQYPQRNEHTSAVVSIPWARGVNLRGNLKKSLTFLVQYQYQYQYRYQYRYQYLSSAGCNLISTLRYEPAKMRLTGGCDPKPKTWTEVVWTMSDFHVRRKSLKHCK